MNQRVIDNAIKYLGADVVIKPSTRQSKKFMVLNPEGKYIHFGQKNASDFTIHQDKERQKAYLARATAIKGNWKDNKYSPNNLSIHILWS